MPRYVAFLRGINPLNPNMRNARLRSLFQDLGFKDVEPVITSGNVIFQDRSQDSRALENRIENALRRKLRFSSTTIVRNERHLKTLVKSNPFGGKKDAPRSRHHVTFLKKGGEVFTVIDPTSTGTPRVMLKLEQEHGKEITTRTWKTIARIVDRL